MLKAVGVVACLVGVAMGYRGEVSEHSPRFERAHDAPRRFEWAPRDEFYGVENSRANAWRNEEEERFIPQKGVKDCQEPC